MVTNGLTFGPSIPFTHKFFPDSSSSAFCHLTKAEQYAPNTAISTFLSVIIGRSNSTVLSHASDSFFSKCFGFSGGVNSSFNSSTTSAFNGIVPCSICKALLFGIGPRLPIFHLFCLCPCFPKTGFRKKMAGRPISVGELNHFFTPAPSYCTSYTYISSTF